MVFITKATHLLWFSYNFPDFTNMIAVETTKQSIPVIDDPGSAAQSSNYILKGTSASMNSPTCKLYEGQHIMLYYRDYFEVVCEKQMLEVDDKMNLLQSNLKTQSWVTNLTLFFNICCIIWLAYNQFKLVASNVPKRETHLVPEEKKDEDTIIVNCSTGPAVEENEYYNDSFIEQYYQDELNYYTDEVTGLLVKHPNESEIVEFKQISASTQQDDLFEKSYVFNEFSPNSQTEQDYEDDDIRIIVDDLPDNQTTLYDYLFNPCFRFDTSSYTREFLLNDPILLSDYRKICYDDFEDSAIGNSSESSEYEYYNLENINTDILTKHYHDENELNEDYKDKRCKDFENLTKYLLIDSRDTDIDIDIDIDIENNLEFICSLIENSTETKFSIILFEFIKTFIIYQTDDQSLKPDDFIQLVDSIFKKTNKSTSKLEYSSGIKCLYWILSAITIDNFIECFPKWFTITSSSKPTIQTKDKSFELLKSESDLDRNSDLEVRLEILKMIICHHYQELTRNKKKFNKLSKVLKPFLSSLNSTKIDKIYELKDVWNLISMQYDDENLESSLTDDNISIIVSTTSNNYGGGGVVVNNDNFKRKLSVNLGLSGSDSKKLKGLRDTNRSDISNF